MLKVVSNTTPIISFLSIRKIEILKDIYDKLIIPFGVFYEIEKGKNKVFYTDLTSYEWVDIKEVKDVNALNYINDLDRGEAEVIVLANEIDADLVIIDEKIGRAYANYFNLRLTGTLGILLKAK